MCFEWSSVEGAGAAAARERAQEPAAGGVIYVCGCREGKGNGREREGEV